MNALCLFFNAIQPTHSFMSEQFQWIYKEVTLIEVAQKYIDFEFGRLDILQMYLA